MNINIEAERKAFVVKYREVKPEIDGGDFMCNGDGCFAAHRLEERFEGWLLARTALAAPQQLNTSNLRRLTAQVTDKSAPALSDDDVIHLAVGIRDLEWTDVSYPTLVSKIRALLAQGAAMSDKRSRLAEANALVAAISKRGRRFFYNKENQRIAHFELGSGDHIFFIDDYSSKRIYVADNGRWRGFSHGGTLRDLVKAIASYIRTGNKLSIDWIGPERFDSSNIWGYEESAMTATRSDALLTGVVHDIAVKVQP